MQRENGAAHNHVEDSLRDANLIANRTYNSVGNERQAPSGNGAGADTLQPPARPNELALKNSHGAPNSFVIGSDSESELAGEVQPVF